MRPTPTPTPTPSRHADPPRPPTGVSTDSEYAHFAWATQDRKAGGLGPNLKLPLVADRSMRIARDYGVLIEDKGVALRGLFLVDPKGVLRCARACAVCCSVMCVLTDDGMTA